MGRYAHSPVSLCLATDLWQHCTISAACNIPPYTRLPDYTVIFGGSQQRIDKSLQMRPEILDARMTIHTKQLDMFRKLIPNNIAKWT